MEPQSGCLPLLMALILVIGGLFLMPMSSTVEVSGPVVIEGPRPSPSSGS